LTTKIRSEEETYAMLLSQYDKARVDEAMRANSISIAEPAIVPGAPSKPNIKLNLALGALVGLMGGMGLALLLENLNPAIYSMDDLEATAGASLLGRIPSFKIRKGIRQETILLKNSAAQSLAGEAFRTLSTNTLALTSGTRLKTVLVSSAEPRAGKSTVLANLAAAMAQAGRRVVVVDSDLRNPCVHEIFGLAREPGLCDAILNPNRLGTVVQETGVKGVRALTAGSSPLHPAEVLNAPSLLEVIQKLTEEADIVLWDSPPVLTAADAAGLAPTVDGVVLVVEYAQTRREDVQTACQQLAAVRANLIGIVVNRAEQGGSHYYYHRTPNEGG
jgi:capsular exopolysaccharide synthesis family protein